MIRQLIVKTLLFSNGVQQYSAECIAHLFHVVNFSFLNSQHWLSNHFFI